MAFYRGDTDHEFGGDSEGRVMIAAHDLDEGGLQITGSESLMYDETDWTFAIGVDQVNVLRAALDAGSDDSLADLFVQRIHEGSIPGLPWRLGGWFRDIGVEYTVTENHWKS